MRKKFLKISKIALYVLYYTKYMFQIKKSGIPLLWNVFLLQDAD